MIKLSSTNKDNADRDFVITLYEKYARRMRHVARRYGPEDQAEDNVQEAFVHLLDHVDTLKCLNTGQLNLYLMKTVQYVTLNRNKSNSRRKARETAVFMDIGEGIHP